MVLSNYFLRTRELLIRFLGSRELLSTFKNNCYSFFCYEQKVKQANKCWENNKRFGEPAELELGTREQVVLSMENKG